MEAHKSVRKSRFYFNVNISSSSQKQFEFRNKHQQSLSTNIYPRNWLWNTGVKGLLWMTQPSSHFFAQFNRIHFLFNYISLTKKNKTFFFSFLWFVDFVEALLRCAAGNSLILRSSWMYCCTLYIRAVVVLMEYQVLKADLE